MTDHSQTLRYLHAPPPPHLRRPVARLQPVLARAGRPNLDIAKLRQLLTGQAVIADMLPVQSPEHWADLVRGLDESVDAILPVSIPAYPTEVWNSHPQPLVARGLPVVFWSLLEYDEPDFWRWAACDLLRTLGVEVTLVKNYREGLALIKALALRRLLRGSKIVVFGEQNFPWNAHAVGERLTRSLGLEIAVRPVADIRARYNRFSTAAVQQVQQTRLSPPRYMVKDTRPEDLQQAIRTYLAIRALLQEEHALGFGVNCFGDLVIRGGRDVPCLAQLLLREEGYVAACDGDFIAIAGMALASYFLDKPGMMSNLYPVSYVGALTDHFGDPLSPGPQYPPEKWPNLARLAHCGTVGVVSPEMTPGGQTRLRDWGGTYEIKRDGRGCGADGDLAGGEAITLISLGFAARRLVIAQGRVVETTFHPHLPHCETSALLELRDLDGFVQAVSRDHVVVVYGDHQRDFEILAQVLGLDSCTF